MDKTEISNLINFSKKLKVLYVEDNEVTRVQTFKMLSNFFENITVAVDGLDGLEKFKKDKFQLVITDINMPNKNGIEMLEAIKKDSDEIFYLVISAHNETNYFIELIELGIDGFLLKPVKISQFTPVILKTIQRIKDSQENKEVVQKQAKLAVLGEMMDAIAHQWKQPLGLISMIPSSITFKLENDMEVTKDEFIECSTKIKEQIDHIVDTLDDFRGFFRPHKNKEKNTPLKKIIDSVLRLMKIILVKADIEVKINCEESIQVNVIENEFKHVFINLINNTKDAYENIKFEKQKIITIDVFRKNNKIFIEFIDNAGGIKEEIIKKIFEPNFTTKKEGIGTGVGLYMTKQIVEKVGGIINVYNNENGATFKIEL